ncbi:unnamed protein product [Schistocephalus solidus]|uniref:Transmembrane protein 33 n=1 Tax=Schistocephalus solidus TaxID=70667 RepID=A0A3P7F2M9_SCHSO|nr:unnamed protein product [Schistocephalus solidus]
MPLPKQQKPSITSTSSDFPRLFLRHISYALFKVTVFCIVLLHCRFSMSYFRINLYCALALTCYIWVNQRSGPYGDSNHTSPLMRTLQSTIAKVRSNEQAILRVVAMNEIMLMGVAIFLAFSGSNALFLPFLYFQFLKLRYASRRNPFCRFVLHHIFFRGILETPVFIQFCPYSEFYIQNDL